MSTIQQYQVCNDVRYMCQKAEEWFPFLNISKEYNNVSYHVEVCSDPSDTPSEAYGSFFSKVNNAILTRYNLDTVTRGNERYFSCSFDGISDGLYRNYLYWFGMRTRVWDFPESDESTF